MNKREMKDSGIPWIGEIPIDWRNLKFKYSGSFQKGKLPNEFNVEGNYIVKVGEWINDVDKERFSEMIQDEFNLPDNFQFEIDEHWNLGHGWSEENMKP